ncbi:MAG: zonular occludens toxin domain-containing protein, partial [Acidithiobacillales bacterium]
RSRELILLADCIGAIWEKGGTARLESLVPAVASPPFSTVGALPLETFYPAKERQALVLALNNVVASPATAAFRKGVPLDVGAMLEPGAGGRPRLSIVSIAHLSDAERLFVVATLLARVKAWVRSRPGSSTLKALLYIDEIYGFFPPSASPPTKPPLLALLKQARAFGFGVVLATQNPVDLDYKGLANCGCWWVGTLQTERDRERLASGLSDTGGSDAAPLLGKTRKRVFILHDVHARGPVLMETRWAMSYLRGPMTREEIARVRGAVPRPAAAAVQAAPEAEAPPPIPAPWPAKWVRMRGAEIATPHLYVKYAVRYKADAKTTAPETTAVKLFPLDVAEPSGVVESEAIDVAVEDLLEAAPGGKLRYGDLPTWLGPSAVKALERSVKDRLPDKLAATLLKDPVTGSLSLPGESGEAFARRIAGASAPAALQEKLEQKKRALATAESQEKSRELETAASVASAAVDLLGGLLGKRKSLRVRRVGSVLTKRRLEGTAESRVEALRAEVEELSAKVAAPDPSRFESVSVVPARSQVDLLSIGVAWVA